MNNLQTNTSGIDCEIKQLQTDLYASLDALYDFDIYGYPIVYKNPRNGGVIPEWWNETTQDYEEVYLDTSKPLSFFFIDGDTHTTEDEVVFVAPLKIVFLVDLSKIDAVSRNDAEAHRVAVSLLNEFNGTFQIEGIEKLVDNVFRGFKIDQIETTDLHPFHVFAIEGKINYYLTKKCN